MKVCLRIPEQILPIFPRSYPYQPPFPEQFIRMCYVPFRNETKHSFQLKRNCIPKEQKNSERHSDINSSPSRKTSPSHPPKKTNGCFQKPTNWNKYTFAFNLLFSKRWDAQGTDSIKRREEFLFLFIQRYMWRAVKPHRRGSFPVQDNGHIKRERESEPKNRKEGGVMVMDYRGTFPPRCE